MACALSNPLTTVRPVSVEQQQEIGTMDEMRLCYRIVGSLRLSWLTLGCEDCVSPLAEFGLDCCDSLHAAIACQRKSSFFCCPRRQGHVIKHYYQIASRDPSWLGF